MMQCNPYEMLCSGRTVNMTLTLSYNKFKHDNFQLHVSLCQTTA